jgi:hypothetical protein
MYELQSASGVRLTAPAALRNIRRWRPASFLLSCRQRPRQYALMAVCAASRRPGLSII